MTNEPTAIVTGASRGIGFALADALAGAGWNLVVDARDAEALSAAAGKLRAHGGAVTAVPGDIADAGHRQALVDAAGGRLDLLVNNAGILGPSPLPRQADLDLADLRRVVEVNTVAPLALTQLALPLLRRSRGIVADLTSDAAVEPYPGWGAYGAAKAATEQLRHVLAAEEPQVTVWRLDPGDVRTDMHQAAFPGEDISDRPLPATVAPGLLRLLEERPPSGRHRLVRPEAGDQPVALWLTLEVDAYDPARAFYRDVLGLDEVDSWSVDGENGSVFAVGSVDRRPGDRRGPVSTARIEVEKVAVPVHGARAAIEYPSLAALTAAHLRIGGDTEVIRHHRGHSGFTVHDPRGTEIYLWAEK